MPENLQRRLTYKLVHEDPKNIWILVYAGTELGLSRPTTEEANWIALNLKNLPNVSVHDILVHQRDNDLILATHGRSIWIFDDASPIQQLTQAVIDSRIHLFPIRPALRFTSRFSRYGIGDKAFAGANPPYGALITYFLKEKPDDKTVFKVQVFDQVGKLMQDIDKPAKEKGLNRIAWNLRYGGPEVRRPATDEESAFSGPSRGPQVMPGAYVVRITIGDKTVDTPVEVRLDPTLTVRPADLESQLDLQMKLRDMQSATNTSLRFLDSIVDQLKHTQSTIKTLSKEPDKDLVKFLDDSIKQAQDLEDRLANRSEGLGRQGKARIVDSLGGLFFAIDSSNAAPTQYQRQYFEELQPEYRDRMAEVNKFVSATIPQWNERLRAANAPTLTTRKPVEF